MKINRNHYSLKGYPLTSNSYVRFHWRWWKEYLNPKNYWLTVKYFCQRGWRGYASCDHWDADSYFEAVMLGVMKDLKEHSHGYPSSMADYKWDENPPEGVEDKGLEKWQAVLQEIIDGLAASRELAHKETVLPGTYSDEPVVFEEVPDSNGELFRMKDPLNGPRFNAELYEQWAEPLRKKKARAGYLLRKHWGSFWD